MRRRIRRGAFVVPGLVVLLGGGLAAGGVLLAEEETTTAKVSTADCLRIRESRKKRRQCFAAVADGQMQDARTLLTRLPDDATPLDRDLVRLRVAADAPRLASTLCKDVETAEGRRLCARISDRPHLYATSGDWVLREKAQQATDKKKEKKGRGRGGDGREDGTRTRWRDKQEGAP